MSALLRARYPKTYDKVTLLSESVETDSNGVTKTLKVGSQFRSMAAIGEDDAIWTITVLWDHPLEHHFQKSTTVSFRATCSSGSDAFPGGIRQLPWVFL